MESKSWLLLVAVSCLIAVAVSIDCYQCSNLDDPDYCTVKETCTEEADTCYSMKKTKESGSIFYNLGCAVADIEGCTCLEGQTCQGEMTCCEEDGCNSAGMRLEDVEDPVEGAATGEKNSSGMLIPCTLLTFLSYFLA